jgi:hypothetical protein
MQTIHPSALSVGNDEEAPPGSVRLGPAEFAITLPLDSRLKDEYDRVLGGASAEMRQFLVMSNPASQISDTDVRNNILTAGYVLANVIHSEST